MDGVDRSVRRPSLKERLGLKGLGCCGPTWGLGLGLGPATMSVRDDEEDDEHRHGPPLSPQIDVINAAHNPIQNGPIPPCSPGMNLAAALAAERQLRAALDFDTLSPSPDSNPPRPYGNRSPNPNPRPGNATSVAATRTPLRVSLMRLLEETDGCDGEMKRGGGGEGEGERGGSDSVCCVCMGRKKGAAFIPCGHTFCRVCSREVWLNRGSCPLCNRSILEILDIY